MQTFDELEKKWLDAHHEEYKAFTRLLLSFSVGALSFLIAFQQQYAGADREHRWLALFALFGLLLSSLCGVLIQHRLMQNYLDRLEQARRLQSDAQERGDGRPIAIRQPPSRRERVFYKVQVSSFFVSFVALTVYAFLEVDPVRWTADRGD